MNNLGTRRLRQRAHGPGGTTRAGTRAWHPIALGVLLAGALTFFCAGTAQANAPGPTGSVHLTALLNANNTVTLEASGTWLWMHSDNDADGGLNATVNIPCDRRSGVGWGVMWSDPDDPGFTETYASTYFTHTVHMGSTGVNALNTDKLVAYNPMKPCGTFVQTNRPKPGDGYVTGQWTSTHVYASAAAVPASVCVVTYDLGFGKVPLPKFRDFSNDDNSVAWQLQDTGAWSMESSGINCDTVPPPTPAPPTPTTVPPAKTVAKTTPAPTTPPPATPKAAVGSLAFTGFGAVGRLMAVIGTLLVALGLCLYFFDVRKAGRWFLGL